MAARKSSGFDLETSLSQLLRRAQQFAYEQFADHIGGSGLTPRQFIVLLAVDEEEGLSQTDLVNRTGIDRSTLADMINRMTRRGLLARRRTMEDARANAVKLTAAGRRALKAALPKAKSAEAVLMELLPASVQRELVRALGQLTDAVQSHKEVEEAKPARKTAKKKTTAKKKATPKRKAAAKTTRKTAKKTARKTARKTTRKKTARKRA